MTLLVEQLTTALAGRYTIDREIGHGGMATVYLARDLRHDRRVALKVLLPELAAVIGLERFLTEIRVTAHLQHPNLLPLFDSGEADGLLYYVMPFVDGESLRARLDRETQLPVQEAVRIAAAVANALDFAHRHGVIHRDLKPDNILLQDGQPMLADFGIALAVTKAGGARITQTGLSLGTPAYMSPEQATADRTIDGRTDIYSLGAVLYEMLAGDPPHQASTAQAVLAKVLTERPQRIRTLRQTVPDYVEAALDRALSKLPADRFATAREFEEAITGARRFVSQSIAFVYEPTGDWVKAEDAPLMHDAPAPFGEALEALYDMERQVLQADALDGLVLRYGFFYGRGTAYAPDGYFAREVRRRRFPIVGSGDGVTSFIHVEDAAGATVAAVERGAPGIYNVCDDEPAPGREWIPVYAQAMGAKRPFRVPKFIARLAAGPAAVTLTATLRGASNAKAKRELDWQPRYPSWRRGFAEATGRVSVPA